MGQHTCVLWNLRDAPSPCTAKLHCHHCARRGKRREGLELDAALKRVMLKWLFLEVGLVFGVRVLAKEPCYLCSVFRALDFGHPAMAIIRVPALGSLYNFPRLVEP